MRVFVAGCAMSLCLTTNGYAQVRDRAAATSAAPRSDAAALAAGWTAAAAGRVDAAVKEADTILQRRPWDRAALTLKIGALAAATPLRALDAYEQWIAAGHTDDAALLEPVAIGILQEIANGSGAEFKRPALHALAAARVAGAQQALDALPASADAQMDSDVEKGRAGDAAAVQRLTAQASTASGGTPTVARALGEIGTGGESGLLLLVKAQNPQTRAAAAEGLGGIDSDSARAALKALGQDADPMVRVAATISLAQLGESSALSSVERMLANNVPDMQLAAARAWKGKPGPWVAVVKALLDNPDGLTKIEAAQAIAPVDPDAASRVLDGALSDPNPVIRYAAASAIDERLEGRFAGGNLATLRQRLRDRDTAVRFTVAKLLLRLAQA
jgi:HEAT repeat protein